MLTEPVVLYHLLSAHVMCKQVQLQCTCLAVTKMCTAVVTSAQQQVPCLLAVCIKFSCITCPMGSAGLEVIYQEDFMQHLYNSYAMLYLIESCQHIT